MPGFYTPYYAPYAPQNVSTPLTYSAAPKNVWLPGANNPSRFGQGPVCGQEAQQLALLRSIEKDYRDLINDAQRQYDHMEFLSKGLLVSALVMETSIGFLNLAASAFGLVNPAAARAAKLGVESIRNVEVAGKIYTGEANLTDGIEQIGSSAAALANPKSILGKVALEQGKTVFDATIISIKSVQDRSPAEMKSAGLKFVDDRAMGNYGIVKDSLKDAGHAKSAAAMQALEDAKGVFQATADYRKALESRFDTRIDDMVENQTRLSNTRMMYNRLIQQNAEKITKAAAAYDSCLINARAQNGGMPQQPWMQR